MLGRLLLGMLKGLVVGGVIGLGVAKLGFAAPGALVAYLAAALTGVVIGLVAGKPIWAKDAKIEAGMKAAVGALLGAGLMYVARRWLTVPIPISLGDLGGANLALGEVEGARGTLGGLAVTSLAVIAMVLGGFYEADNDPSEGPREPAEKKQKAGESKRIAASHEPLDDDATDEAEPPEKMKN